MKLPLPCQCADGIALLFCLSKCNVDEYIILCIDGEPHKNIMVPLNGAVRINIDYDPLERAIARN